MLASEDEPLCWSGRDAKKAEEQASACNFKSQNPNADIRFYKIKLQVSLGPALRSRSAAAADAIAAASELEEMFVTDAA